MGSVTIRAPFAFARSQWAFASSTLTITECVTSPRSWRSAISADVADDHGSLANAELGAMVLADAQTLDEPESPGEPVDCLADIRVDQNGYDGGWRD